MLDANFVQHEIRVMKRNVTVSLDDVTARWVRVEAAKRDVSVSQFLADLLLERRQGAEGYAAARAQFMGREPRLIRQEGDPLPARDDLHERGPRR
jgi:hypothetical protein